MESNDRREKLDSLLEEYRQIWGLYKHQDNMASNKEAIYAVAAFGVLALIISNDFSSAYVIGAAFVSIALYLFQIAAFNRMRYYREVWKEGIKKSEIKINELISNKELMEISLDFFTNLEEYKKVIMKENIWGKKGFRIRRLQWYMLGLLCILWLLVILFPSILKMQCKSF